MHKGSREAAARPPLPPPLDPPLLVFIVDWAEVETPTSRWLGPTRWPL